LGRRMVQRFALDLSGLVLDMTNFATFIDSTNDKAPIAQRGKAKQKRTDLRLVGLGLVLTRDGGVPVLSHAYPGDPPDATHFSTIIDELVARYRDLAGKVESLTVVYDAGQNSHHNHAAVEATGLGFVGSLPPSDHPDLLAIPRSRYRPVDADRFDGLSAYDTTVTALRVTRPPAPARGPGGGAPPGAGPAPRGGGGAPGPAGGGPPPRRSRQAVQAEIATICKPRWVSEVLTATLTGEQPAELRLTWRTDAS